MAKPQGGGKDHGGGVGPWREEEKARKGKGRGKGRQAATLRGPGGRRETRTESPGANVPKQHRGLVGCGQGSARKISRG